MIESERKWEIVPFRFRVVGGKAEPQEAQVGWPVLLVDARFELVDDDHHPHPHVRFVLEAGTRTFEGRSDAEGIIVCHGVRPGCGVLRLWMMGDDHPSEEMQVEVRAAS